MNVLITGAASGIGLACKNYYIEKGHNVYALDINEIEEEDNLVSFKCDITNEDSLLNVKNYLDTNNIKIDIILNIAGIHKMASLVESDFNDMKKVIDINLLGTMLVNRVLHSSLCKKGRIVIVTSEVASFDPMPFNGLYNVSKTALDCYAQALRQELNLLGQKVITIRPGAIETPLSNGSLTGTKDLADTTFLYQKQASKFMGIVTKFMGKPLKPCKLAKFIYKKSIKKNPRLIYKKHQNIGLVLLSIMPKRWQLGIIKFILK